MADRVRELLNKLLEWWNVLLLDAQTTKEASEVRDLLEAEGLLYQISDDGNQIRIKREQQADARLLLAANDIQAVGYTLSDVTEGGFSTTESDKQKRYEYYMENRLANDFIARFSSVKSAVVDLSIPQNDGTLIATREEASAWILLTLDGEFTEDNGRGHYHYGYQRKYAFFRGQQLQCRRDGELPAGNQDPVGSPGQE